MENRREENEQDVYIYPMQAKRKLRLAKKNLRTVYIYGVTGIGKTALLSHFLENRDSLWLDAAKVTEEELLLALQKEQMAVVVDNIQFAEPEEIRNGILALTAKTDIWLLIAGRCPCPPWLAGAAMKHVPFLLIEEEELRLSEKEMQEYLEASQVELGGDMVRTLCQQVNGHPLALKIAVQMMKQRERGPDTKQYVYDEEIFRKGREMFWDYVETVVYDQWEPGFAEFFQQLSIVDSFDVQMAEAITGRRNVEAILKRAKETGNFLREENGEYTMISFMLQGMRRRMAVRLSSEQKNELYYNAGCCYAQKGEILDALRMFEACGNERRISNILVENARINPGTGHLYELRGYYQALPHEVIKSSIELTAGMSMLQSILLNVEESEYWYNVLKERESSSSGREKLEARSWLAYLAIALPHRGIDGLADLLKNAGTLLKNRKIILPEFSVTSNAPSMMNGGKDFCEWSKRDKELAASIGKVVSFVLGRYGAGLVELALAESFLEKGEDFYEVIRLASKGQMIAKSSGKTEQCFVAVGLLSTVHLLSGHAADADFLLTSFREEAVREKADKLLPNIENLICRIQLYRGNREEIESWMKTGPEENGEFCTFDRYRYLTKVRIYLLQEKYALAWALIHKLLYYAQVMHRTWIDMECRLLLAICQYRMGKKEWKESFQEAYSRIEEYHFVRLISREAGAVLPLLKGAEWDVKDEGFFRQVLKETKEMAGHYPAYLKQQEEGQDRFSENAIRILQLQAKGFSHEQIAEELGITLATVKYHCKQTYQKLGVKGKAAAVAEAGRRGLI